MQEENELHIANNTWKLTNLPKDHKSVRCNGCSVLRMMHWVKLLGIRHDRSKGIFSNSWSGF